MRAWLKASAWVVTGAWGVAGALGLGEAVVQWLRFGPPAELAGAGWTRALLPPLTLHGWVGAALATLLLPAAAALVARRARRPRRAAGAIALAGAAAAVPVVWAGYLLRERLAPDWWAFHGAVAGKALLLALWVALVAIGARLARRPAALAAKAPAWLLLGSVAAVAALTLAWPDWRAEGAARRTRGLAPPAAPPAGAPNVLLVSIDALRRDHLSCASPDAPPTPVLDALAAEGARCANAWSPSPWTLPGVGALLTGLPPRALDVAGYRALPAGAATLAGLAWEHGWATAAFATNPYLTPWYGFDRGFAAFEHALFLEPLLPAERAVLVRELVRYADLHHDADAAGVVVPKAIRWLTRHGRDGPFLLWLHLLDPHLPYTWRELPAGAPPATAGRPPARAAVPAEPWFPASGFAALHEVRDGRYVPDAAGRRAIATLYAREVQYADAWCGRLFAALRGLGLWDDTLVIVTADHGEELFDHGGFEHGHSLLPEVTGVPLIVRLPREREEGVVVADPVSLLDVVPTICATAGFPAPDGAVGRDLRPQLLGDATGNPTDAPLRLENMLYGPPQLGVLGWPWLRVAAAGDSAVAWYDLAADPRAFAPLPAPPGAGPALLAAAAAAGSAADSLAARLRAGTASPAAGEAPPEEIRRQLRSLGY